MKLNRLIKRSRAALLSTALLCGSTALAGNDLFMPNGVTKPVERSEMGFATQGIISQVLVKPGDPVKVGQPLVQLDDSVERKTADSMAIEANSDLKQKAAEADLAQKKVELDRKKKIQSEGGMNDSEVEDAQLSVVIDELSVELAKQTTAQKKAELDAQLKRIEKMRLTSLIDGVIEKVNAHPGEVADPSKPAVVVVDTTKLEVEASLPTDDVNKLKVGDTIEVRYEKDPTVRTAKIIFLDPEADAASSTRLVRAEMANNDAKPSGMSVAVKLPGKAEEAAR